MTKIFIFWDFERIWCFISALGALLCELCCGIILGMDPHSADRSYRSGKISQHIRGKRHQENAENLKFKIENSWKK